MENKKKTEKEQALEQNEIQKKVELQKKIEEQKQAEEQKVREKIETEKPSLLNFLIQEVEARTPKNTKKKNSKDEVLKKYLVSVGVTSIIEQDTIIAELKQPYRPHFQYEKGYYKEIFRLNAWDEDESYKFNKPKEVAVWTVRLIYGRFMKALPEIMTILKTKNKYIGFCIRRYKFFEFLTPDAQILLDQYIEECIEMMKTFNDWYSFEKAYCSKYDLPYQKKLFDND